jgi:hypothetical protein
LHYLFKRRDVLRRRTPRYVLTIPTCCVTFVLMKRNRRAGVEDRWFKTARDEQGDQQKVPSARHGKGMRWMARYVDERGREHARGFDRKSSARAWLDQQTAALVGGTHVAPRDAALTVAQWCELWLKGYAVRRESTVAQARVHIRRIVAEFGDVPLTAVRPSRVKAWVAQCKLTA